MILSQFFHKHSIKALLLLDPQLTSCQLALHGEESGSQNYLGTDHSPQEGRGISEDLTDTTEDAAKVHQKLLNSIHRSRIAASGTCAKFS